jgi:hypothetical protein
MFYSRPTSHGREVVADIYSSGSYGLFTPEGIGKRVGTLKNGHVRTVDTGEEFRVYANHLFVSEGSQNLGRCVGEIDSVGLVSDMDGRPMFKLVPEG